MATRSPALAAIAAMLLACGGDDAKGSSTVVQPPSRPGAPAVTSFDPDVRTWRGGCFFAGPAGKIVNGSPSSDVRMFGHACDPAPGPGGLVYLDRFDPVTGTGDVTVLLSAPGSAPVVVGKNGGGGGRGLAPGSAGVRLDASETKLLTLANVRLVTGTLQLVDLAHPDAAAPIPGATGVRVENYDWLPGDAVVYVGNYDGGFRTGDIVYLAGPDPAASSPVVVAAGASRFDFVMYRVKPGGGGIAWISALDASGGQLFARSLPPTADAPTLVDSGVQTMTWTGDGHLVYFVQDAADPSSFEVRSWNGSGAPVTLARNVSSLAMMADRVVVTTGWSVLTQRAALSFTALDGGGSTPVANDVALSVAVSQPDGASGVLAYAAVSDPATPFVGDLFVAALGGAALAPAQRDTGISTTAGFAFSPAGRFVAYAKDFRNPVAVGSASPQPGIAGQLRFTSAGGPPADLGTDASFERIAWDPAESLVAAIEAVEPAANRGELVVKRTGGGDAAPRHVVAHDVNLSWFGFSDDGATLAFIRNWDDGLQRGQLAVAPTSGAWAPAAVGEGATFFLPPRAGRVVYGVRGNGRDGLWVGP